MNKQARLFLVLTIILSFILVFVIPEPSKEVNWKPTYARYDKIPYGYYILYDQLKRTDITINTTHKTPFENYKDEETNRAWSEKRNTYIIKSLITSISSEDSTALANYLAFDNNLLLLSRNVVGKIFEDMGIKTKAYSNIKVPDDSVLVSDPVSENKANFVKRNINYIAKYPKNAQILLVDELGNPIAIYFTHNHGGVIFCSAPDILSNYAFLTSSKSDLFNEFIKYLPDSENWIWDEYFSTGRRENPSPLRVINAHPAIGGAFYTALIASILLIVFTGKRKTRPIAIIDPIKNKSVEFATIIARLHYKKGDHSELVNKRIKLLHDKIRSTHYFPIKEWNDEEAKRLAKKLKANEDELTSLFSLIIKLKESAFVTKEELLHFHQQLDKLQLL